MHDDPEASTRPTENVRAYPRPPRVEPSNRHLKVVLGGVVVAETRRSWRVVETGHPPVYYFPSQDVQTGLLVPSTRKTTCEWKGRARYYHVYVGDRRIESAVWTYPQPAAPYEAIRGHLAFYPALMDACYVDGELVTPEAGAFYGGWITGEIRWLA